jgi:hypothetical protein
MSSFMPRATALDKQWRELMSLCESEAKLLAGGGHPRLSKLIARQIDELARDMGFNERTIVTRDFRAERDGDHIVKIIRE